MSAPAEQLNQPRTLCVQNRWWPFSTTKLISLWTGTLSNVCWVSAQLRITLLAENNHTQRMVINESRSTWRKKECQNQYFYPQDGWKLRKTVGVANMLYRRIKTQNEFWWWPNFFIQTRILKILRIKMIFIITLKHSFFFSFYCVYTCTDDT